ncbi:hypothetical protein BDR04DRAFT_1146988 [Suillus decipiens]|nr:hypothetical protein BDR04DRAFT_1146988 [Suillus decipiens]
MIARLHAMYQRSRKVLIPLVLIFLPATIFVGIVAATTIRNISGDMFNRGSKNSVRQAHEQIPEDVVTYGNYICAIDLEGDYILLDSITWILGTIWEVLALLLAVWIAVKRFRELRQRSAGGIVSDCFTVLIKTHMVYYASVVSLHCSDVQMFVLGPRLILGVREYHAKLVTDSDAATDMTSIAFQERVHL